MIKSIKVTNFCSIGRTQTVDFEILPKDKLDDSSTEIGFGGQQSPLASKPIVNLVNCFIGHNASGKTNMLKAMAFLLWLMRDSYTLMKAEAFIPVQAHQLHEKDLTKIEMEFFNEDGTLFQYKVALDRKQIHKEFLGQNIERGYTKIFEYERSKDDWEFKSPKMVINKNDLLRFKERKNVSVLSSLLETGYLPNLVFIKKFTANVTQIGHYLPNPRAINLGVSKSLYENADLQRSALEFIKDIDIGISEFGFFEDQKVINELSGGENAKNYFLKCIHTSEAGKFELSLLQESSGTRHSLQLLAEIIPILKTGGVAILDEIECGLHPHIVKKIISLFENRESNPHLAQLMFSTHQHFLLNDRTKTQIFITEKENNKFETEIFRLDEVEGVRNDENYFHKYLAGTYGGVPRIKWIKI